jgi:hypothetical protein
MKKVLLVLIFLIVLVPLVGCKNGCKNKKQEATLSLNVDKVICM